MSCSDEYISHTDTSNLIQISPSTKAKLKKAKYGVYNHSAVELCHWTKNLSLMKEPVTNTNSMVFQLIGVWK